jgi:5'-nucleotidase/UDP-sugar diphosphatase
VKDIWIGDEPLEAGKKYIVATNDFLAAGGDGYKVFGEAAGSSEDFSVTGSMMKGEKLAFSGSGRRLRDAVLVYIREKKVISPHAGGRIATIP